MVACPGCSNRICVPSLAAEAEDVDREVKESARFASASIRGRSFTSYDECPGVIYDWNENGPIQDAVSFLRFVRNFEHESFDLKWRFEDEDEWRTKTEMIELWSRLPPSQKTLTKLRREGISIQASMTERECLSLLKKIDGEKSITPSMADKLKQIGINPENVSGRAMARDIISAASVLATVQGDNPLDSSLVRKVEVLSANASNAATSTELRTLFYKERDKIESERQREADRPEFEKLQAKLNELAVKVREFDPEWKPKKFTELCELKDYAQVVELALEYVTDSQLPPEDVSESNGEYWYQYPTTINKQQVLQIKTMMFNAFVKTGDESFNHRRIIEAVCPDVIIKQIY